MFRRLTTNLVAGVLLAVPIMVGGCSTASQPGGASSTQSAAPARSPQARLAVEMTSVVRSDLESRLAFDGTLVGLAEVDVVPGIAGKLETVRVDLGDRVWRGDPLAQIRDDDLASQVRQAEHAFAVAQATLRQREVDLTLAETTRDRSRQLFEEQLVARDQLEEVESRAQSAAAQVDLARAQFAQNEARLDEVRILLGKATVRSPLDGFVAKRHADVGAFASTNAPVVSVVDISRVKLVAHIVERDFRRVQEGLRTRVSVDAYPGERFDGIVARVAPVLDERTRTAEIQVEIANADFRLKPGMNARVEVVSERRENVLVLPRTAFVDTATARGVFTVRRDAAGDVATFVSVETGVQDGDRVEVVAGIAEGEEVVTTGAAGLSDGDLVTVTVGGSVARRGPSVGGGA